MKYVNFVLGPCVINNHYGHTHINQLDLHCRGINKMPSEICQICPVLGNRLGTLLLQYKNA